METFWGLITLRTLYDYQDLLLWFTATPHFNDWQLTDLSCVWMTCDEWHWMLVWCVNYSSLIWSAAASSCKLVRLLHLQHRFCVAYHRGLSLDRSSSCCTLLTCCCLLRAMVSALICMQMTPKSMGSVVRLQRWSFRTASLPASMMWPGWEAPTGSSWILQRARFNGLHPVDACICYLSPVRVCSDEVKPGYVVHNIGIYMDADALMRSHVSKTVAACFAILRQLRSIRRAVLRAFYSHWFRLSFCNAGCHSIPSHQADAVGGEFCCSACVFCFEVRPHHATPDTVALAEGARGHRV